MNSDLLARFFSSLSDTEVGQIETWIAARKLSKDNERNFIPNPVVWDTLFYLDDGSNKSNKIAAIKQVRLDYQEQFGHSMFLVAAKEIVEAHVEKARAFAKELAGRQSEAHLESREDVEKVMRLFGPGTTLNSDTLRIQLFASEFDKAAKRYHESALFHDLKISNADWHKIQIALSSRY